MRRRPMGPVLSYAVATTVAGALVGAALGFAGATLGELLPAPLRAAALLAAAGVAVTAVWLQLQGRVAPLPERHAQVSRNWTRWSRRSYTAAAFGLMLGAGFLTYLIHATAYVLAIVVLVGASPSGGALAGAVYGLTRGVVLAYAWFTARGSAGRYGGVSLAAGVAARLLPVAGAASIVTAAAGLLGSA